MDLGNYYISASKTLRYTLHRYDRRAYSSVHMFPWATTLVVALPPQVPAEPERRDTVSPMEIT